ncbi:hypothetical protein HPB49_014447 [Dermacentor silvarum]|uniref:Uncharacterized protein n=1 Tax=Dermacentor silvarum TaxID=543639 RepID=A0ACB8D603_DERSI|nr:hypothetical protein HPB49_014447 [Dermacentor silvarum]
MPPLPTEDIKIVIRPKRALHIAKIGSLVVTAAILQAAKLADEESLEETVCPNTQQNIVVFSTPHSDHADRYARISSIQVNGVTHELNAYETAAEHTTKGIIRGIPLTETSQQIYNKTVTARNPTALAAKRIASTATVIIAFDGRDVPFQVRYGSTLLPCSLYRKQIDICYHCVGHCVMDVCPYANNKICRGCGARNPPPPTDHNCNPRCFLCGGPHLTADKSCAARYKTPCVIRKRIGERRATSQATYQQDGPSTLNTRTQSRSRTPSRRSRSRSKTPSRSRQQRSRSRSASASRIASTNKNKVSFAEALKGTSREGRKINTHAPSPPPSRDNPEIAHLKRENAILRDLPTKLTQEVRDLKQSQTPPPTPIAQNAPDPSQEAPTTPAPKKRALQDGAMGQIRSKLKTCSPHFKQLGTAEAFTKNNRYLINTYANIPAARMLSYFKKPITPPPRFLVIKPFIPPTIFAGSPP